MNDTELRARNILAEAFGCDADEITKAEVCSGAAVLQAQEARSQWNPMETAPKDGTNILLAGVAGMQWVAWWGGEDERSGSDWIYGFDRNGCSIRVPMTEIGWMPLPDAPVSA